MSSAVSEGIGSVASTVGKGLVGSSLGLAELIVALVVGLMLLAFALPATRAPRGEADGDEASERLAREPRG